jgi:hypothetical protein
MHVNEGGVSGGWVAMSEVIVKGEMMVAMSEVIVKGEMMV